MKLSDLTEGPIVGAPKGSQKDARLSPGTDDPDKYMRGGEWEAYHQKQGVGSRKGKEVTKGSAMYASKGKKKTDEGFPPSGAGDSNDYKPRQGAIDISAIKDTTKQNREKGRRMAGAQAPVKTAQRTVKKSLDNRPGNVSAINEHINQTVMEIVTEAVAQVPNRTYDADYEIRDDKDEQTIGVARINAGVIEILSVRNDLKEDFEGHIMSRLLSAIVRDADLADANLALAMDDPNDLGQKRFLERFGFRDVGKGLLKRNAGSVTPPSVPSTRL